MTSTFVVFRHGLATKSKLGYGPRALTAGLLEEAKPSVYEMAHYLNEKVPVPDAFICSPVLRCQETAEIVSTVTRHSFLTEPRVSELHQESFVDFSQRVVSCLRELEERERRTVWICTHGAVIGAITSYFANQRSGTTPGCETDYPNPPGLRIFSDGRLKVEKTWFIHS